MNTDFFLSNENLVGAIKDKPYFSIKDAIAVTGVGPDMNASCITDRQGDIIIDANNENLIWLGGCIHRFPSRLGYGPMAIKRALQLQKEATQRLQREHEIIDINQKAIFLGHAFGWHAYGHLHDTLQRLYFCIEECKSEDWKIVVNRHDRITNFIGHLSALMGKPLTSENVITINNKACYRFNELVYSHSPATLTTYTPESLTWIADCYRQYFKPNTLPISGIYLSRNHVRPGTRGVVNESEVLEFLAANNFVIVDGTEDLSRIVELFSSSPKVVGPHGSLLANTFLCTEYTDILELCPNNRVDVTFKNKLRRARSYKQVILEADAQYNIEVDIDLLKDFIGCH